MMQSNQKSQMKDLLTRIYDSYEGYKECAEQSEQARHQRLFKQFADERLEYANELKDLLEQNGEQIELDGSMMANVHRLFTNIKNKIDNDDDEELLEEIARGEDKLAEQYQETISEFKGDEKVLSIIQPQYKNVINARDLFEAKEEAA